MVAVAGRILLQVRLMFLVGRVEGAHAVDFRLDLFAAVLDLAGVQQLLELRLDGGGDLLLTLVAAEDGGAVLRPNIIALTVLGGGVVKHKEELDELLEMLLRFVELDVEHLDVARGAGADLLDGGEANSHYKTTAIVGTQMEANSDSPCSWLDRRTYLSIGGVLDGVRIRAHEPD